ncbi:MAG: hypothetical protein SCH39_12875 [Methanosarcinales archaeon]|nr:hypothetical protein [Methanosarcinales archaeon]
MMEFEKVVNEKDVLWFEFTCPFCSRSYRINKTWERVDGGSTCMYDYPDDNLPDDLDHCQHLMSWDNSEGGSDYNCEINELELLTRMSDLPFRVWDVLQEVVNNDGLPEGCEVGIRAFYVNSYIVFIFCNDPQTLAHVVLEKTKEHIRRYNDLYSLDADDLERYSEILVPE